MLIEEGDPEFREGERELPITEHLLIVEVWPVQTADLTPSGNSFISLENTQGSWKIMQVVGFIFNL